MQQDLRALAPPSLHHADDEGSIPWEPPPGHRLPTACRVLIDRDHLGPLPGVGVKAQPAVVSEQEVERRETGLSVGSHGRAPARPTLSPSPPQQPGCKYSSAHPSGHHRIPSTEPAWQRAAQLWPLSKDGGGEAWEDRASQTQVNTENSLACHK